MCNSLNNRNDRKSTKEQEELKNSYKIVFVDRVLDPVHGFIDLTEIEREIISLPIFKRMQSLKQLSLTNWIFPGAEHTRYIHSLGVMHIVDLMGKHLQNIDGSPKYNEGERQILRLAGLLHDIGHYPLSHVTESAYMSFKNGLYNLDSKFDILQKHHQKLKADIDKIKSEHLNIKDYMKDRSSIFMHHERIGTEIIRNDGDIKNLIDKYCPFANIDDICDIIVGCVDKNPKISSMVQLMHSELDADGIDYILRDATFSGTSYGGLELGLLLRNLVVGHYPIPKDLHNPYDLKYIDIVGIRPKGISVTDQYLICKYYAYTQVIFNKHVSVLEKMVEFMSQFFIQTKLSDYLHGDELIKFVEEHNCNDLYLRFNDRTFWAELDNFKKKNLSVISPDYIIKIYEKLINHQELKVDNEIQITTSMTDDKELLNTMSILQNSSTYKKLENDSKDFLAIFHSKSFTNQLPEEKFRERIMSQERSFKGGTFIAEDDLTEDDFSLKNLRRLQEGIAIIVDENQPKLLVDSNQSLMSQLYKVNTYILREYSIK